MKTLKRVVLYGNSLVMSTIGACLQGCPDLVLLPVDPSLPDVGQRVGTLQPEVVIFDLGTVQPDTLLSLLQRIDLLLIGLNAETHQALVWSGRQTAAVEAADLVSIIWKKVTNLDTF